jgi:hypothetical protein
VTARRIPDVGLDVPVVLAGSHQLTATGPKRPLRKL